MTDIILTTFDWVPEMPRGMVRDIRVRWALEEAGLPYQVKGTPFKDRPPEHFMHQPFGQVPWLTDGDISIFESGAILLHIGNRSDKVMPADVQRRSEAIEWVFAALNSVEMASLPWSLMKFSSSAGADNPFFKQIDGFLNSRLQHMDSVLAKQEWLAGSFCVADILMADVLRLVDRCDGLANHSACKSYLLRATSRPYFQKAYADQLQFFADADRMR